jgi:hypothetical protein
MHQIASHLTGEFIKLLNSISEKLQTEFPYTFLFSERNSSESSSNTTFTGGRGEAARPEAVQAPRCVLPV